MRRQAEARKGSSPPGQEEAETGLNLLLVAFRIEYGTVG